MISNSYSNTKIPSIVPEPSPTGTSKMGSLTVKQSTKKLQSSKTSSLQSNSFIKNRNRIAKLFDGDQSKQEQVNVFDEPTYMNVGDFTPEIPEALYGNQEILAAYQEQEKISSFSLGDDMAQCSDAAIYQNVNESTSSSLAIYQNFNGPVSSLLGVHQDVNEPVSSLLGVHQDNEPASTLSAIYQNTGENRSRVTNRSMPRSYVRDMLPLGPEILPIAAPVSEHAAMPADTSAQRSATAPARTVMPLPEPTALKMIKFISNVKEPSKLRALFLATCVKFFKRTKKAQEVAKIDSTKPNFQDLLTSIYTECFAKDLEWLYSTHPRFKDAAERGEITLMLFNQVFKKDTVALWNTPLYRRLMATLGVIPESLIISLNASMPAPNMQPLGLEDSLYLLFNSDFPASSGKYNLISSDCWEYVEFALAAFNKNSEFADRINPALIRHLKTFGGYKSREGNS